ncbi:unnamed protein product [Ambrosiozyma monospora]|uniref:Unnamed protein product n=1 Tax=Ambrosiozyma monospora TaxID=43982 RepID=A0A9W6YYG7_AMBMO|nr:unnamed protein product [Ambrosiozyma monospora]
MSEIVNDKKSNNSKVENDSNKKAKAKIVNSTTKNNKSEHNPLKTQPSTKFTLCVPSSCISKSVCGNLEQVTHVAYQIAKAACLYNVGEIVVLQIPKEETKQEESTTQLPVDPSAIRSVTETGAIKKTFDDTVIVDKDGDSKMDEEESKPTKKTDESEPDYRSDSLLLASLLQFFVTPPYLLKSTFKDKDLLKKFQYAKKLPKISTLPFMQNNSGDFKEGLTIDKKPPKREKTKSGKVKKIKHKLNVTKFVNVGEAKLLELATPVPVNVRVTVNIKTKQIVSPLQAYGVTGAKASFGYQVRISKNFISMFTEASYSEGYSKSLYVNSGDFFFNGTSKLNHKLDTLKEINTVDSKKDVLVLLVVSKWRDLCLAFDHDKSSLEGVTGAEQMFDGKLGIPSGTRIEDGSLIALAQLSK